MTSRFPRSVGLPVSGLKSVQSFGLAQILRAMVDLGLSTSPCVVFREFTIALNPLESLFLRLPLIMAEILSALQVMLYSPKSR